MLTNSFPTNLVSPASIRAFRRPAQTGVVLPIDRQKGFGNRRYGPVDHPTAGWSGRPALDVFHPTVEISPLDIVKRRTVAWNGITAEIVQATRRERIEYHFRAPLHLLAVYEQGVRFEGDTFVQGLPRSSLRDVKKKLTFVPAGHEFH